jgi:hypothetical protein
MINIALGDEPLSNCTVGDSNHDATVSIDEILAAVKSALDGCCKGLTASAGWALPTVLSPRQKRRWAQPARSSRGLEL